MLLVALAFAGVVLVLLTCAIVTVFARPADEPHNYSVMLRDAPSDNSDINELKMPLWAVQEYLNLGAKRRYVPTKGLLMHVLDLAVNCSHDDTIEFDAVVIMVHGNPMWSFLWRKVIARLQQALRDDPRKLRVRIIAPDLIGLGLSSKPGMTWRGGATGSLDFHISALQTALERLNVLGEKRCAKHIVIVGQDWGGPIVSGVAARAVDNGNIVIQDMSAVFGNTALSPPPRPRGTLFHRFSWTPVIADLSFRFFGFPLWPRFLMSKAQGEHMSFSVDRLKPYQAPMDGWLSWKRRATPLLLARMVPNSLTHPTMPVLAEIAEWARRMDPVRVRLVWGIRDPILGRALKPTRQLFAYEDGTEHDALVKTTNAGHFLQEQVPGDLAEAVMEVL